MTNSDQRDTGTSSDDRSASSHPETTSDPGVTGDIDVVADIEPDVKDWTWVLQRPCPECGFDARTVAGHQVATAMRADAARWSAVLDRADARVRPEPAIWSPLEYGCHVRDVCRVFETRVNLMRSQVDPRFENWDQDATAVADGYGAQSPSLVDLELQAAAEAVAAAFDAVGADEWERTGRRSNGAVFTLEALGQYLLHDVTHHLHDVRG